MEEICTSMKQEVSVCCHFVPLRPPGMNTVTKNIDMLSSFCDQRATHVLDVFVELFDHESYLLVNYPGLDNIDTIYGRNKHELNVVNGTKSEICWHF